MKEIFGKCGCTCSTCPAFKANAKTMKNRKRCRNGWNKYLGTNIKKYEWIYCDGCQASNPWKTGNLLPDRSCNLRPCAIKLGIKYCAYCSEYPCKELKGRIPGKDYREKVARRLGHSIPEKDYLLFIEPYEGIEHLDKIRASLKPKDIVKMPKVSPLRAKIVDFPEGLPLSKKETSAFKSLHSLLRNIITARAKTYAKQVVMKRRRAQIFNILWVFGFYGKFDKKGSSQLIIDGQMYGSLADFSNIVRKRDNTLHVSAAQCLRILKDYGVGVEYVPLKKMWFLKLSFSKKAGGIYVLKALKRYITTLVKKYGKPSYIGNSRYKGKAFTLFSQADMQPLMKKTK